MGQEDVMVILGDSVIEYSDEAKVVLAKMPATILCMQNDAGQTGAAARYTRATWNGGTFCMNRPSPTFCLRRTETSTKSASW